MVREGLDRNRDLSHKVTGGKTMCMGYDIDIWVDEVCEFVKTSSNLFLFVKQEARPTPFESERGRGCWSFRIKDTRWNRILGVSFFYMM